MEFDPKKVVKRWRDDSHLEEVPDIRRAREQLFPYTSHTNHTDSLTFEAFRNGPLFDRVPELRTQISGSKLTIETNARRFQTKDRVFESQSDLATSLFTGDETRYTFEDGVIIFQADDDGYVFVAVFTESFESPPGGGARVRVAKHRRPPTETRACPCFNERCC